MKRPCAFSSERAIFMDSDSVNKKNIIKKTDKKQGAKESSLRNSSETPSSMPNSDDEDVE